MRKSGLVFVLIGFLVTGMFTLSGCNGKDSDKKTIGIVQQVEHPALDAVRESFLEKLEKEGFKDGENITVDYQNASNDKTNLKTICQKFVSKKYNHEPYERETSLACFSPQDEPQIYRWIS